MVVDGGVPEGPINGEAEGTPEALVFLNARMGHLQAQGAELLASCLAFVDFVSLLDEAFGRQAVVVKAHRVENGAAAHSVIADDKLCLSVGHRVSYVEVGGGYV